MKNKSKIIQMFVISLISTYINCAGLVLVIGFIAGTAVTLKIVNIVFGIAVGLIVVSSVIDAKKIIKKNNDA